MNRYAVATFTAIIACSPSAVFGHGTLPIVVSTQNGTLSVSGGATTVSGYAANVFADPDDQAPLMPLPNNANLLFTTLPSFKLNDLAIDSGLFLEGLPRRQVGGSATPRWLWYWNPATQAVETEPHNPLAEVITNFDGEISISQLATPVSASVQLATPTAVDLAGHADLMRILLSNSPAPTAGVYGFFARVTSPSYGPSAPFFIGMSLGLDNSQVFQQGAEAINVAAGLAADFNFSGGVDGADLLVWQQTLGASGPNLPADANLDGTVSAADLAIWKSQFSQSAPGAPVITIPEPASAILAVLWITAIGNINRLSRNAWRSLRTGFRE